MERLAQLQTGKRIVKNFLSLTAANIISRAIGFVTIAYLARTLNANGFGKISFAQAIIAYFSLLTDLGLKTFGIREVAKDKERITRYVSNIVTLRILLAVASFCLLLTFLSLINKPTEYKLLIAFFGLSLFPSTLFLDWTFQGIERMEFVGLANIVRSTIYAALVLLFVKGQSDILSVPLFALAASLAMISPLIYSFLKRFGSFSPSFDLVVWKEFLVKSIPMGFSFIMVQVYYNLDTIMLGFMKGDEVVGFYNAAYKIILIVISFGGLFIQTIFPLISRYYGESKEKLSLLLNGSAKLMISIAIPLGIGGSLLAGPIMNLIYGPEYQSGVIAFQILIWTVAVIFVSINFGNLLKGCDKAWKQMIGVSIGAVANIILNLLLIPRFSLIGASIATLATEIIVIAYMAYQANKVIKIHLQRYILKPVLAGGAMGIALILLHINVLINIPIGIIIYIAFFLLFKGVDERDIQLIRRHIIRADR